MSLVTLAILKTLGVVFGVIFCWVLVDFISNRAQKVFLGFVIGILAVIFITSFSFPLIMIKENWISVQSAVSVWIGIVGAWTAFIGKRIGS